MGRKRNPEGMLRRAQMLRQEHEVARTLALHLVECAMKIREAEMLEREVREMRAKNGSRDARIVRVALANPEMSTKQVAERFGTSQGAVTKVLGDAGVHKGDTNGRWKRDP